jgi:copper homeostasis protein
MKNQLEIACFNIDSVLVAQENGVDRIELCANIQAGGTTPDFETTKLALKIATMDLYAMIRPRAGDFVYSENEFLQMKLAIEQFKKIQVNGFVFGILNSDGTINKNQNAELVSLAQPLPCTFHRAFDEVKNAKESLETVIECGFKNLLTSGQASNVIEGINTLTSLVEQAGNSIAIMPGGGLRSTNCKMVSEKTRANFYHSSAIIDGGETANPEQINALKANLVLNTE